MTYQDEWALLSSRILGLTRATQLYGDLLEVGRNDAFSAAKELHNHADGVLLALEDYQDTFRHTLPPKALDSINNAIQKIKSVLSDKSSTREMERERLYAMVVLLGAFQTEMSFLSSDTQQAIRSRAERAFLHLQRLIVVDKEFRAKWEAAFKAGEIHCEKLGAVHLLLHGIFAFKVNAEGARTDLVFQDRTENLAAAQGYVDGFVLTEWKRALSQADAARKFEEARSQAQGYAQGVLAGSELRAWRYAVVVSHEDVDDLPDDLIEGDVVYRHINIAIEPRTPSQRSRRQPEPARSM